jgi:hypothetical protein
MAIPWIQLVKLAPAILSATQEIRQHARRGEHPSPHPPETQVGYFDTGRERRIEALQSDLMKQAEALHALAQQVEGVTAALGAVRKTVHTAIALGTCALFAAGVALIVAVVR